ncbi:MAG: hypothetical protein EOO77_34400 [Oxalobacteraceae bacterium]|nr:MAG: hypothetical protein EOO77_34400 [Oxalobacteraceae bacterium]
MAEITNVHTYGTGTRARRAVVATIDGVIYTFERIEHGEGATQKLSRAVYMRGLRQDRRVRYGTPEYQRIQAEFRTLPEFATLTAEA